MEAFVPGGGLASEVAIFGMHYWDALLGCDCQVIADKCLCCVESVCPGNCDEAHYWSGCFLTASSWSDSGSNRWPGQSALCES